MTAGKRRAAARRRDEGFSLLEVVIVLAVALAVLGTAAGVVFKSEAGFALEIRTLTLEQLGRKVADRILDELRSAEPSTIRPLWIFDSRYVFFRRVVGYGPAGEELGPYVLIGYRPVQDELRNGYDDNGDSRADEGIVYHYELGGTYSVIGANILDLRFNAVGNGLEFELDVALVDRQGAVLEKTFRRRVTFRN